MRGHSGLANGAGKGPVVVKSNNHGRFEMLQLLTGTNQLLAFLLELAMLAAFGYSAFVLAPAGWPAWAAAIAIVAVAIVLWAIWAAPTSSTRLPTIPLVIFKLVLFGAASAALAAVGRPMLGVVLIVVFVINLGLAAIWQQL